jgi:hypothetical protein
MDLKIAPTDHNYLVNIGNSCNVLLDSVLFCRFQGPREAQAVVEALGDQSRRYVT